MQKTEPRDEILASRAEYDAEFKGIAEVQKRYMREGGDRTPTQSLALCRCC